jgi:hypothetical protein
VVEKDLFNEDLMQLYDLYCMQRLESMWEREIND